MKNTIKSLADQEFDLIVVGAGIIGSTICLEAARAGYRVALLEKKDFGHSTSANSLKIVHGGIRYLQHGDLKRMRESIISRRSMMSFAPHLVKPLPCMMPTYGHSIKGREMMRLAFGLYDLVAWDRNKGLDQENHLPPGGAISVEEVKWAVPGLADKGLTGGAVWYDAMALSTERLVLEYVREAVRYGASAANYTEVTAVESEDGQVTGVSAKDCHIGETVRIRCRALVNAAGPWLQNLAGNQSPLSSQLWATAINIVVKKRLFKKYAVGLEGYTDFTDKDALIKRGKRLFFFVPLQSRYTMIGTNYTPYRGNGDDFSLHREDLQQMLDDVNKIYPAGQLTMDDVTFFHGGLLPMSEHDEQQADSVQLDKSSRIIDHEREGGSRGLFSIKGVKYTTAPDIALKMVSMLESPKQLGKKMPGSYQQRPSPGVDFGPAIRTLGTEYETVTNHLKKRYGKGWREVFKYLACSLKARQQDPLWLSQEPAPALLAAEIDYFVDQEMALTLGDLVFRRSDLGSAECPEPGVLDMIAKIMGRKLGWDDTEKQGQITRVLQVFTPVTGHNSSTAT